MLPKIDLLLITIILNGSNLMSEHQWLGSMAKQPLFVQALIIRLIGVHPRSNTKKTGNSSN